MNNEPLRKPQLFFLRIWAETLADGQVVWRGKLQALPAGEAAYFQGWSGLMAQLESMLDSIGSEEV